MMKPESRSMLWSRQFLQDLVTQGQQQATEPNCIHAAWNQTVICQLQY